MTTASPGAPGSPTLSTPGQPGAGSLRGGPVPDRVGHRRPDPGERAPRAARSRRAASASSVVDRDVDRRGEAGRPDHVEGPRAHVALLAAAVLDRGERRGAPGEQRADPDRSAELVRGEGQQVEPAGGEVDRHVADRLHGVAVHDRAGRAGAAAATSATGCTVPTSLLAHITDTTALRGDRAPRRTRRGRAGRSRRPPSSVTCAPWVWASQSAASPTAWCSTALTSTSRRSGVAPGPVGALDREVVRLGAAAGEDDLGRLGARAAAATSSRASSTTRRAARPEPCADDGLPVRVSSAVTAATASGPHRAWSPRGRGRPAGHRPSLPRPGQPAGSTRVRSDASAAPGRRRRREHGRAGRPRRRGRRGRRSAPRRRS